MDDSAIICDEVIDTDADAEAKATSIEKRYSYNKTKIILTNFNKKKATCKTQNFYILLVFLLTTVALSRTVFKCLLLFDKISSKTVLIILLHK